jgi:hypothetical protein
MAKRKWRASCKLIKLWKICRIHATLIKSFTKATPLMFHQALEASGGFLIIYQLQLAWI